MKTLSERRSTRSISGTYLIQGEQATIDEEASESYVAFASFGSQTEAFVVCLGSEHGLLELRRFLRCEDCLERRQEIGRALCAAFLQVLGMPDDGDICRLNFLQSERLIRVRCELICKGYGPSVSVGYPGPVLARWYWRQRAAHITTECKCASPACLLDQVPHCL